MFWEPADWISGIVNGDPLALLPLVPSAARFASHASSPLSIGRRAASHLNQSIPASTLCSFDADTIVATSDGSIRIDQIKVDDKVLAYDEDSGEVGEYSVTAVLKHDDPIMLHLTVDGETVDTTPEHPFYTVKHGWVAAGELQVGDRLRKADGSYGVVQSIHTEPRSETMYNLTVEEAHTFFVGEGQWLVHNECKGRVLLIGDGDFSFARSLVETGQVQPSNLVVTELLLEDALSDAAENIAFLKNRGIDIQFGIDARKLDTYAALGQFDTIRWNFPRDGGSPFGAPQRMRDIFDRFFATAQTRLNPLGKVEIALDNIAPYTTYGFKPAAAKSNWVYLGHADFVHYPGYKHRYTTGRGSREMINPVVHSWSR